MARTFTLDVESTGTADLAKVGADVYWQHPDTRVICVCFKVDDGDVHTWRPGDPIPYFADEICLGDWRVVAHNYLFEFAAWKHALWRKHGWGPYPPVRRWDCTMARALYWGLPASLIEVAGAMALPMQIDPAKKTRIKRMARPRTTTPLTWWDQTDPDKLAELLADCVNDVNVEYLLDLALPALPDIERRIFIADGHINLRGVRVDLDLIDRLIQITDAEGKRLNAEMSRLTGGAVTSTNQTARIMSVLERWGSPVDDLTKETVKAAINRPGNGPLAQAVLLVRQEAAKASTAKLQAMVRGAGPDGRCRGLFQYGGAGRTLRWAGRRVQPQNYPRGTLKGIASFVRMVMAGASVEELADLLPCSVMDAVSSALRACFISDDDHLYISADLAQIEARVVAWLAGQQDVLDVFARGEDVYTYQAGLQGSSDRQFGKVLVLACGFGMGPDKFATTALTYGVVLTPQQAQAAVSGWRRNNPRIEAFWYEIGRAFCRIAQSAHGTEQRVGAHITIRKTKKAVRIVLPSGHELTYQNVEIEIDEFGRESPSYMGVDSKTKKWSRIRTYGGKLVENITQAVARDVMGDAMVRIDRGLVPSHPAVNSLSLVATVHDELLGEAPVALAGAALAAMLAAMKTVPDWARGLPVDATGWIGRRYKK